MRAATLAVLALLLALPTLAGGEPAPSATPTASAGRYRATSDRTFEDVAHWTAVFDDPARDDWQKPAAVIAALDIGPGATVADLGAGTGYFVGHLAAAVGPTGTVLAVETEPNLVAHLRTRVEKAGYAHVVPILASRDNPRLPAGTIDLILIVDTFHHIDERLGYFRRLRRALARRGRVAIIDWQKRDIPVGPERDHKLARSEIVGEMADAGYRLVAAPDVLPYQYLLVFAPE